MGSCFSAHTPSAKVITSNGALRVYTLPATVSIVLHRDAASSPSFFLCHSDSLSYDNLIPVLDLDDHLLPNQLYFILPNSMLQRPLSNADMAALAVVAGSALAKENPKRRSPISSQVKGRDRNKDEEVGAKMEKSGSVRRLHRYTSRRAKMAVRSFRMRLLTIYEAVRDDSRFN